MFSVKLQLVINLSVVEMLTFAGFVVDFISHPVINSFTTAAAITIGCSQIKVNAL